MDIKAAERELLARILVSMKDGSMPIAKAKQLAKEFVYCLPADEDSLCRILDNLADQYQEARAVYISYAIPYKEQKRREKVEMVTAYIRKGDVEKALQVARGGE